jgi:hypothetical protein
MYIIAYFRDLKRISAYFPDFRVENGLKPYEPDLYALLVFAFRKKC